MPSLSVYSQHTVMVELNEVRPWFGSQNEGQNYTELEQLFIPQAFRIGDAVVMDWLYPGLHHSCLRVE